MLDQRYLNNNYLPIVKLALQIQNNYVQHFFCCKTDFVAFFSYKIVIKKLNVQEFLNR